MADEEGNDEDGTGGAVICDDVGVFQPVHEKTGRSAPIIGIGLYDIDGACVGVCWMDFEQASKFQEIFNRCIEDLISSQQ